MRVVTGTSLAAGLILVACVTPSPQRTMNDAKAPYPLVIIDGVKRPDLPPTFRYTGAVVVETTTTPTYRITYRGPRVMDSVAKALYPSADEVESMQMIDPPASVVHFGEEAKYGATLYYTKKYRAAGGAIIAPAEGNRSARRADPSTTTSEMAGRAYDHMFAGITLTPDVAARARAIVENEMTEQRALVGPGLATWPRRVEMNVKRDAELRALLTSDADRARFDVRSSESPTRGAISMEQVEGSEYGNLFVYPNQNQTTLRGPVLPADLQVRARAIIRSAINDELVLYARAPNAWKDAHDARVAIRAKRDADLRALVPTEEEIAKFDKIAARLRELTLSRP